MERIVVGIDGSTASGEALAWAADLARRIGASIEVVHAWQEPFVGGYPYTAATYEPGESERSARQVLDVMVDKEDESGLAEPIRRLLLNGPAAPTLLAAAQGAYLLVVGSRGQGGFEGLLLGSVSQQLVHHAGCPVVVIPPAG